MPKNVNTLQTFAWSQLLSTPQNKPARAQSQDTPKKKN